MADHANGISPRDWPGSQSEMRFITMLDRMRPEPMVADDEMLRHLDLSRPQFDGFKAAVDALSKVTSRRAQNAFVSTDEIEAILTRGGWTKAIGTGSGRAAWLHAKVHCNAVFARPNNVLQRQEEYGTAYQKVAAALAVNPGPQGKYSRHDQLYECAACAGAGVVVGTGEVASYARVFEVLTVFPLPYRRAALLTLDSPLFYGAFPEKFRSENLPNRVICAARTSLDADHTDSWMSALVLRDDWIARTTDWQDHPPEVYIGAGLTEIRIF